MDYETQVKNWISNDPERMEALTIAATLELPDWCLASGFVRNLVWDKLHGFSSATALNDIDLIYFDPYEVSDSRDREIEHWLRSVSEFPWSVKNQARMHKRNMDSPYASTEDAMSFWVEVETAVGAALGENGEVIIVAPFGIESLFDYTITSNPKRPKPEDFKERMSNKRWLETWPRLVSHA